MPKNITPNKKLESVNLKENSMTEEEITSTKESSSFPAQLLEFTKQQKQILSASPNATATQQQIIHSSSPYDNDSEKRVHFSLDYLADVSSITESSGTSANTPNSPMPHQVHRSQAPRRANSESSLAFYSQTDTGSVALVSCTDSDKHLHHLKPEETVPLTTELSNYIRKHLPPLVRIENVWKLIYSTERDGFSLKTLYSAAKSYQNTNSRCLLVVQDTHSCIFGAFLTQIPEPHLHHYGTGECFLWKWKNETLQTFQSTGLNDYYLLSEPSFIAIGCSEGQFGIWLDGTLRIGTTGRVSTYANDQLCERGRDFDCKVVQLWLI